MKRLAYALLVFGFSNLLALDFDLSGKAFLPKNPTLAPLRAGQPIVSRTDTSLPSDVIVLRKQIAAGKYAMFQGRLQKDAKASMRGFRSAKSDAWNQLLHAKFFSKPPTNDLPEVDEIYWDAGLLLSTIVADTLYAQTNQGTEILVATHAEPVNLQVSTDPIRATVSINGTVQGSTPADIHWLGGHWFLVRIDKFGYQSWEDIIEADANGYASIKVTLTPRPSFQDGAHADSLSLNAHGSMDYQAVARILSQVLSSSFTRENQELSLWLSDYLDTLRNRQYVEFIPPQNLAIKEYNASKNGLPVRFWYGENDFDFGFEGFIPCSREEATVLKDMLAGSQKSASLKDSERSRRASWPSAPASAKLDGFVRLIYRNWATEARSNSRTVHRYLALDGLELVFPDRTIPIVGNFLPASYIKSSKEWKEYLKASAAFATKPSSKGQ